MILVFIRGAPAVGKTTTVKKLLRILKEQGKECAYISEDHFRRQMQYKYSSGDPSVHRNASILIQSVILKLLEFDSYDYIFIEGEFRYKQVLDMYERFVEANDFVVRYIQFDLDLETMASRIPQKDDLKDIKTDIEAYTPDYFKHIETNATTDEILQQLQTLL